MKGRLIKWDATQLEPVPQPLWQRAARAVAAKFGRDVFPTQYRVPDINDDFDPRTIEACLEVIEMHDGQLPQTVYRR